MSFDAHAPGTPSAVWDADPRAAAAPPLDLDGVSALLVVAAHPDDETLAAGGLVARCARLTIPVTVVIVTDGAASHPGSLTHPPHRLREIRAQESRRALERLAPGARLVRLELPDGGVDGRADELDARLAPLLDELPADALVAANWAGDGHRDHRVVGERVERLTAARGLRHLGFPLWFWHWGDPDDAPWDRLAALDLDADERARKQQAVAEHRSQLEPLSPDPEDRPLLEPHVLEHFDRARELYVVAAGGAMPGEYFAAMYRRHDDPWRFQTRWYEARKRALTTAALPRPRYRAVLELGCSIGVLTAELADRADAVTAVDISERAVQLARARLRDRPHVRIDVADVTAGLPDLTADLVVMSEIGYYLAASALDTLVDRVRERLDPDGDVLVCHWRHPVADYRATGDAVHDRVRDRLGLALLGGWLDDDVRLDVFSGDARSVAEREGLT